MRRATCSNCGSAPVRSEGQAYCKGCHRKNMAAARQARRDRVYKLEWDRARIDELLVEIAKRACRPHCSKACSLLIRLAVTEMRQLLEPLE